MGKHLKIATLLAIWFGIIGFLGRHEPGMPWIVASVAIVTAVIFLIFRSPRLLDLIEKRALAIKISGFLLIALAVASIVLFAFLDLSPDDPRTTLAFFGPTMAGILLITLPSSVKRARPMLSAPPPQPVARENVPDVWQEVVSSVVFVFDHVPIFVRVVAPWLLLTVLLPLGMLQAIALRNGTIASFLQPVRDNDAFLLAFISELVIWLFASPAVAIAWHRFVLLLELPRFRIVLFSRAFWRYLFRLWIFGLCVSTFDKMLVANAPDLVRYVGADAANPILTCAAIAVWLLAVWLAAPLALVLPAIAVGDKGMDGTRSMTLMAKRRWRFGLGLVGTVLGFYLAASALDWFLERAAAGNFTALFVLGGIANALIFIGIATSATYLSRAYKREKDGECTPVAAYPA